MGGSFSPIRQLSGKPFKKMYHGYKEKSLPKRASSESLEEALTI